jgi:hypothetical protein
MLPPVVSGSGTTLDWTPCSLFRILYSEYGMRRTAGTLGEGCLGTTVAASSDLGTIAVLAEGVGVGSVFAGGLGGSRLWGVDGRSAVDACSCSSSSIGLSCSEAGVIDGVVRMVEGLGGGGGDGCLSSMGTSSPFGVSKAFRTV